MSAPTRGARRIHLPSGRTAGRCEAKRTGDVSGSTPRRKKRSSAGSKKQKDLKEYDNLAASAYLRAKEDYLMGINFSRLLTLKYGNSISNYLNTKYSVVSVGRVMTCVLGMVVRQRTGDPGIRRDPVLQSVKYNWRERFDVRGRMESGQRIKMVRILRSL